MYSLFAIVPVAILMHFAGVFLTLYVLYRRDIGHAFPAMLSFVCWPPVLFWYAIVRMDQWTKPFHPGDGRTVKAKPAI